MVSLDYAMINWLKSRLSKQAAVHEVEETPEEVEENIAPVGVRVRPSVAARDKPADTNIAGYNVDETVSAIKTIGVDPYNSGSFDLSDVKKPASEK